MSNSRLELKVGLFVAICLIVLAGLMLQFSKGTTFLRPTYSLYLRASNVGSLRARASVLMSGVQVGTVARTDLSPEGTNVTITLTIYKTFVIHRSARFVIEQAGFLGDQYVAIYPDGNQGPMLQSGDEATAQEPFNLQEVARGASGFIKRIDETASRLNDAISDVRRLVLNEQTLTNLACTIATFRRVSEDALGAVAGIDQLVVTNRATVAATLSNLVVFSEQLDSAALTAHGVVATNAPQVSAAVSNLLASTAALTNLLGNVQAGHGLAGAVLENQQLATDFSTLASNLALTSQNLNEHGLWRVLWGPKHPSTNHPALPTYSQGRGTFQ
jgi:phospholipid/cholesterol/gamma-HCH transport system substrate-binding protein